MQPLWNAFNGLTARIESLVSENKLLKKRNQTLETQLLHSLNNERTQSENKDRVISDLHRKVEQRKAELSNVKVVIDQEKVTLNSEKHMLESQKTALEDEIELFKKKLHKSDLKILELQNANNALKAEQNQQKVERNDLIMEIGNIKKLTKNLQTINRINEETITKVRTNISELTDANQRISDVAKNSELEREKTALELKAAVKSTKLLESSRKALERELNDVKHEAASEKNVLELKIAGLEKCSAESNEKLKKVNFENDALEAQLLQTFDTIRSIKLKVPFENTQQSQPKCQDEAKNNFEVKCEDSGDDCVQVCGPSDKATLHPSPAMNVM